MWLRPKIGLSPTSSPGSSQFLKSLRTRLGVSPNSLKLTNICPIESFWLVYMFPKQLTALEGRKTRSRGGRRTYVKHGWFWPCGLAWKQDINNTSIWSNFNGHYRPSTPSTTRSLRKPNSRVKNVMGSARTACLYVFNYTCTQSIVHQSASLQSVFYTDRVKNVQKFELNAFSRTPWEYS